LSRPLRYTFIVGLVALAVSLAAVGGWRYARASAPVNGPIVLISIDALRADRLPAYGYQQVPTPALDALASDGVVFERAYSHVPQTLPAHASIFTGRLPFDTGVRDNVGFTVNRSERLLAEILRDRGYSTGAVVSSHLLRKETGIDQGFTFFDAATDADGSLERDGGHSVAIAERWLESAGTDRLFLFLHIAEPHKPHVPPAPYIEYAAYDGEIAYADELVGRLVRYLKAHQLYDQSTIVLLSDHGEGLGDHGEHEHGLFVYEETVRVPLIVKLAAGQGGGRRVAVPVQHVDILPTILDLAKAPFPDALRGRSLKPLLEGTGTIGQRLIYSESLFAAYHFGWSGLTSITDGRYRYIDAPRPELYDLAADPAQRENLVQTSGLAAKLADALAALVGNAPVHDPADVAPEERERLQRFGYVGEGRASQAGPAAAAAAVDPKDKYEVVEGYRSAVDLAASGRWTAAIDRLTLLLRQEPRRADVWRLLATTAAEADRMDLSIDAYGRAIGLAPDDAAGHVGLAQALLRHRRYDEARRHAAVAQQLDPQVPVQAYVEARILYDRGEYAEASTLFEEALAALALESRDVPRWRFYAADALFRLYRYAEAEYLFGEELARYPRNTAARASLAMLYHATGRSAEAEQALADLVRISPTAEGFLVAARTWTVLGNSREAAAARAASRRVTQ
jgi:arylsulfatase A-like enzyme/predicted Zn-dependent protease